MLYRDVSSCAGGPGLAAAIGEARRLRSVAAEHQLELTWTNKHLHRLADEGGYEWVPPSDYRVAQVRLLHDGEEAGETPLRGRGV